MYKDETSSVTNNELEGNLPMASLTYVCFIPAKGLIRDLSANSSNIAFEVPLAWDETYVCKASHIINYLLSNSYTFFKLLIGRLCNWESLCDIRPEYYLSGQSKQSL